MIKNERQYLITKKALDGFRASVATLRAQTAPDDPDQHAWQLSAAEAQVETLAAEVAEYEQLQQAAGRRALRGSLDRLPALLIQARIARGWSQRELATRLGLQMQKVQQYEATDYAGASLTRLLEVCQALGLSGHVEASLVELPSLAPADQRSTVVRVSPVDMRRRGTVKRVRKEVAAAYRVLRDTFEGERRLDTGTSVKSVAASVQSGRGGSMAKKDVHVVPHDKGWAVKREGADRASSVHGTKAEAVDAGRATAKREHVELVTHARTGKIQDSDSYGNDPHPPRDRKH